MRQLQKQSGFTIVELLIVIVVIGILAAITIVAYGGIQAKAYFTSYKSDIAALNKAILMHEVETGSYPNTGASTCLTNQSTGSGNFITGLAPTYIQKIPSTPNWSAGVNYYAYCVTATGSQYKLIRIVTGTATLPALESTNNTMLDPIRSTRAWGYWSPGGSGL